MSSSDLRREIGFGVGTFTAMTILSLGFAFLVLSLSVGLRRGQGEYLPPGTAPLLLWGGLVVVVLGLVLRLYSSTFDSPETVRRVGTIVALLGGVSSLVGAARQTTVSAPFLVSPVQKALLFLIAFGTIAVGWLLLRASARLVGY